MGRRGQCAILAGRSQFVCRCCSGSGWLRHISVHNDPQAWMYQRYSSGRGCIWRRPLVAVVGVLPSLQVAVSGRSVLLPRDSAAIRMCARAFNGLYSPGPLHTIEHSQESSCRHGDAYFPGRKENRARYCSPPPETETFVF